MTNERPMGDPIAAKPQPRIQEFEGLRGCLAWWVVLFHLGMLGRFDSAQRTRFENLVVLGGWQGVELFIILSGFVIAVLLEVQRETYRVYIVRRFFRLAPVYYVLLVLRRPRRPEQGVHLDRPVAQFLVHLTLLARPGSGRGPQGECQRVRPPGLEYLRRVAVLPDRPLGARADPRVGHGALGLLLGCVAAIGFPHEFVHVPVRGHARHAGGSVRGGDRELLSLSVCAEPRRPRSRRWSRTCSPPGWPLSGSSTTMRLRSEPSGSSSSQRFSPIMPGQRRSLPVRCSGSWCCRRSSGWARCPIAPISATCSCLRRS